MPHVGNTITPPMKRQETEPHNIETVTANAASAAAGRATWASLEVADAPLFLLVAVPVDCPVPLALAWVVVRAAWLMCELALAPVSKGKLDDDPALGWPVDVTETLLELEDTSFSNPAVMVSGKTDMSFSGRLAMVTTC